MVGKLPLVHKKVPSSKFSGHKTQNLFDFKKGVEKREHKKKEHSKKISSASGDQRAEDEDEETEEDRKALQHSEQMLLQKTKIYEELGLPAYELTILAKNGVEHDDEKGFLVDFEEKSWEEPKLSSEDMKRESARKAWEKQAEDGSCHRLLTLEIIAHEMREHRKNLAWEIEHETNVNRRKILEQKLKRKKEMERRMALIKEKTAQRSKSELEEKTIDPNMYNPEDILLEEEEPSSSTNPPESTEQSIEDLFQLVRKDIES